MRVRRTLALVVSCAALSLCAAPEPAEAQAQPAAPSPEVKAQATQKFTSGKAAFQNKRFEEALTLFRESYAMVKSPNSHLWIVYALTELGRVGESYDEALAVSAEAEAAAAKNPKYAQTAQAARDEVQKLRARVAMVTVQVPESAGAEAKLSVAGKEVARDSWGKPMPVTPGSVEIVLTTSQGTTERKMVDVKGGGEATVSLEPAAPAAPTGPVQPAVPTEPTEEGGGLGTKATIGIVVGAVGVAGMLSFAIFGGLTSGEYSTLQDRCPDNNCPPSQTADGDTGRTYQTVANVSLGIGIAGIAAGAGLIIWDLAAGGDAEPEGQPQSTTPEVAVGPGSIVVHGRF
jgi:hypothetical protein